MRKSPKTEALLSIADISRHFSLPESTTRYYCKRFAAYIPSVGEGRRRRYRSETLDVIQAILDQMQKSRTAVAVDEALQTLFPRNAVALSETQLALPEEQSPSHLPPAALQLIERQTTALEGILLVLQGLVQRMADHMDESKEDTSALRKDIDTLRTLLDASEKTQQADIEQLRQWMGRVIQNRQRQIAAM